MFQCSERSTSKSFRQILHLQLILDIYPEKWFFFSFNNLSAEIDTNMTQCYNWTWKRRTDKGCGSKRKWLLIFWKLCPGIAIWNFVAAVQLFSNGERDLVWIFAGSACTSRPLLFGPRSQRSFLFKDNVPEQPAVSRWSSGLLWLIHTFILWDHSF